ncbi:MAG TPA: TIGR00730 family Rossman fold protein [Cyclobacteriaceae bacterium]|nr:TIGR00730 family Rossman fold protein [Cyclobacteriaceae bacterium]
MNVCVFCGSSVGNDPTYREAAEALGARLAALNHTLIYGGGKVGLMGVIADSVLTHNGKVIGIIPEFLVRKEVGHLGITTLEVVHSMHERKQRMADLSDAFVALPGGWGTLDELAEILTWTQLRLIEKPVYILNIESFFDHLIEQMRKMSECGFLRRENYESLKVARTVDELILLLISKDKSI